MIFCFSFIYWQLGKSLLNLASLFTGSDSVVQDFKPPTAMSTPKQKPRDTPIIPRQKWMTILIQNVRVRNKWPMTGQENDFKLISASRRPPRKKLSSDRGRHKSLSGINMKNNLHFNPTRSSIWNSSRKAWPAETHVLYVLHQKIKKWFGFWISILVILAPKKAKYISRSEFWSCQWQECYRHQTPSFRPIWAFKREWEK